jgi:hypothetical protein
MQLKNTSKILFYLTKIHQTNFNNKYFAARNNKKDLKQKWWEKSKNFKQTIKHLKFDTINKLEARSDNKLYIQLIYKFINIFESFFPNLINISEEMSDFMLSKN